MVSGSIERERLASESYMKGCTCAQAVISAFCEDMGLTREQAYKIMEGFGGGFGGKQEVCGAFSAATAAISFALASGTENADTKLETYTKVQKAADAFEDEWGSIRCIEILGGNKPQPFKCDEKVRSAVRIAGMIIEGGSLHDC